MMPPRKIKSDAASGAAEYKSADATAYSTAAAAASHGLDEAPATFNYASADEVRFAESVALMRAFGLIDDDAGRQQVIALARRLAECD